MWGKREREEGEKSSGREEGGSDRKCGCGEADGSREADKEREGGKGWEERVERGKMGGEEWQQSSGKRRRGTLGGGVQAKRGEGVGKVGRWGAAKEGRG